MMFLCLSLSTLDKLMRVKVFGGMMFFVKACRHSTKKMCVRDEDAMGYTIEIQTNGDSSLQFLREDQVKVES